MDFIAEVDYWRVDDLFSNIHTQDILLSHEEKQSLKPLFISDNPSSELFRY